MADIYLELALNYRNFYMEALGNAGKAEKYFKKQMIMLDWQKLFCYMDVFMQKIQSLNQQKNLMRRR